MSNGKRSYSRKEIEQTLHRALHVALVRRNCPRDLVHEKRVARAVTHLCVRRLLSMGESPQAILDQIGEAFSKELQEFQRHIKKGGTRGGWGLPLALA